MRFIYFFLFASSIGSPLKLFPKAALKWNAVVLSSVSLFATTNLNANAIDPAQLRQFAKPDSVIRLGGGAGTIKEELQKLKDVQNGMLLDCFTHFQLIMF